MCAARSTAATKPRTPSTIRIIELLSLFENEDNINVGPETSHGIHHFSHLNISFVCMPAIRSVKRRRRIREQSLQCSSSRGMWFHNNAKRQTFSAGKTIQPHQATTHHYGKTFIDNRYVNNNKSTTMVMVSTCELRSTRRYPEIWCISQWRKQFGESLAQAKLLGMIVWWCNIMKWVASERRVRKKASAMLCATWITMVTLCRLIVSNVYVERICGGIEYRLGSESKIVFKVICNWYGYAKVTHLLFE